MKTYTEYELQDILDKHHLWVATLLSTHSSMIFDINMSEQQQLIRTQIAPKDGAFIGYKQSLEHIIIKLKILSSSKRLNGVFSRELRASKVKVLEFINSNKQELSSQFNPDFKYHVGDIIEVKNFDNNVRNLSGAGIYFYLSKEEAMEDC